VAAPAGSTFTSPKTGGTATALDGTLAANSSTQTFSLTGLALENNAYLMIRWLDVDDAGVNRLRLVDRQRLRVPHGSGAETSTYVAGAAVALMVGGTAWRRRSQKKA
jgi:hypothetical protein